MIQDTTNVGTAVDGGGEGSAICNGGNMDEIDQQTVAAGDDAEEGGDGVGTGHAMENIQMSWMSHAITSFGSRDIRFPLPGEARPNLADTQRFYLDAQRKFNDTDQSSSNVLPSIVSHSGSNLNHLSPNQDSNDSGILGELEPTPNKMDICTITSNSSGSWNPIGSSLGILAQAASTIHSNQDAPNCSAVRRTEVSPPSSRDFVDSATSSLEDVATGMTDEVQGPAHNTQEPAHNGPAHNTQETDLQRAAQKLDTCLVGADEPNSPCGSTPGRICPNCGAAACSNCATITDDVRDATMQFLGEGAEWEELHCLK
jgi:hypothetical protein